MKLRNESFWDIIIVVDVKSVCDAFVGYMMIIQIDYDGISLRFTERCFVFASKRGKFGDNCALKIIDEHVWRIR